MAGKQPEESRRKRAGAFHHGNLADALVAAARELIVARGAAGFSLREVAEMVGVSHAAAYRHFHAKTDLLAEIAVRGFRDLLAHLQAARAPAGLDGRETLRRMGDAYVGFALDRPGAYRVLYHPDLCNRSLYPLLATVAAEAFASLAEVIATAQARGDIRMPVPADVLASAFWAALHGHASLLLDQQIRESDGAPEDAPRADRAVLLSLLIGSIFAPG